MQTSTPQQEFLSIKDAADRYKKAEITIRRFVRSVLVEERQKERQMIHPLPQDAKDLKKRRKPFVYTISDDLLQKHFGMPTHESRQGSSDYVSLLEKTSEGFKDQLRVKDEQIKQLAQAIDELSQRQREANVLMKGLQEKLLLGPPTEPVIDAKAATTQMNTQKKRSIWKKIVNALS